MLASALISTVLFFQVHPKGSAAAPVAATLEVMRERIDAAHVHASIASVDKNRVRVSVDSASAAFVSRLLTQPGNVTFKILPNGAVYRSPATRPFRDAVPTLDAAGEPSVTMRVADPRSFYRFTNSNLNKHAGFYLDGVLLADPVIFSAVSQYAQIDGHLSQAQAREVAAVIDSGPLPVRVTRIR